MDLNGPTPRSNLQVVVGTLTIVTFTYIYIYGKMGYYLSVTFWLIILIIYFLITLLYGKLSTDSEADENLYKHAVNVFIVFLRAVKVAALHKPG